MLAWFLGPTIYHSGYWVYSNPYCRAPEVIVLDRGPHIVIDYTQPLQQVVALGDGSDPTFTDAATPTPDIDFATRNFDAAREAFRAGDYDNALDLVHQVLGATPNDPTAHEFRSLILFAQGKYLEAAAAIHAVLSIGPGWDWTTMSRLYPSIDVYTQQLRQLEAYRNQNPNAAHVHLLLAYHYMTTGYTQDAIRELRLTNQFEPSDQLAEKLLEMLDNPPAADNVGDELADPETVLPSIPALDPNSLFGRWTASRGERASIALELKPDGAFRWIFTDGDQKQELQGEYSIAGDTLTLQSETGGPMIGSIRQIDAMNFNFRAMGAGPGDAGLQFSRSE